MTVASLAWAISQNVPGNSKLVLIALANYADDSTGKVAFDADAIARIACIRPHSLFRYLGALERNGYVVSEKQKDREYWLQLDRENEAPWSWGADAAESDRAVEFESQISAPREHRESLPRRKLPSAFSRERQAKQREVASAPPPERALGIPIVEGTRAYFAWLNWFRGQRKIAPFVMAIVADGKPARGFYRPSLFPPALPEQNTQNLEGLEVS